MPAATSPAMWAMSTTRIALTSSAISRKAPKSNWRGYAEAPTTRILGWCSLARART